MSRWVLFEAVGGVREDIIAESLLLFEGQSMAGNDRRQSLISRFFGSGLGVAVLCAVVSLSVLGGIIWAGNHPPVSENPPVETTQESQTDENFVTDGEVDTHAPAETEGRTEDATQAHTEAETTPPAPVVDLWDGSVASGFDSGKGTASDPYVIKTCAQLAYLAKQVNAGKTYAATSFVLDADLNLSGKEWTPIGTFDKPFKGYFDGQGHSIRGLSITNASVVQERACVGLFGHISDGTLENIELVAPKIQVDLNNKSAYTSVGSLCGRYESPQLARDVSIQHCRVSDASVQVQRGGTVYAGGLLGYVYAHDGCDIGLARLESHATMKIQNNDTAHTGGLVGYLFCKGSGRIQVENFCGYTKASVTSSGTQYISTVGAISAPDGRVTLKYGYGLVDVTGEFVTSNNYKNDGYAMVGLIYSGSAEKSYYFQYLYGSLNASNRKNMTELYFCYYPVETGVDHASAYPKAGVLDEDVWDVSNLKQPKLRF